VILRDVLQERGRNRALQEKAMSILC